MNFPPSLRMRWLKRSVSHDLNALRRKRVKRCYTRRLLMLFLSSAAFAQAAIIADIGDDYIDSSNRSPNNWTYLTSRQTTVSGTHDWLLTGGSRKVGETQHHGFSNNSSGTSDYSIILGERSNSNPYKIMNDSPNNGIEGTDILMHPGQDLDNQYVILRYTVQAADLADGNIAHLSGSFRSLFTNNRTTKVGIVHNFTEIWSTQKQMGSALSMDQGTFNLWREIKAGDLFNFYVTHSGNNNGTETALRGTINVIPEPQVYCLVFGLIAFIGVLIRK